jgi:hypothetical protein
MKLRITIAGFPFIKDLSGVSAIPGTELQVCLNTDDGYGKIIWDGYLAFVQENPQDFLSATESMEKRFKEACNTFLKFMANGRDSFNQVVKMELLPDNAVFEQINKPAFWLPANIKK